MLALSSVGPLGDADDICTRVPSKRGLACAGTCGRGASAMCVGMSVDGRVEMCGQLRVNKRMPASETTHRQRSADMRVDIYVDACVDLCVEMYGDVCVQR